VAGYLHTLLKVKYFFHYITVKQNIESLFFQLKPAWPQRLFFLSAFPFFCFLWLRRQPVVLGDGFAGLQIDSIW